MKGCDKLAEMLSDWDGYFSLNRTPLASCDSGEIFDSCQETVVVYRKGIRCYDQGDKSAYDYNLQDIQINESRLLCYSFQLYEQLGILWSECATVNMVKWLVSIYRNPSKISKLIESYIDWDDYKVKNFNSNWLEVLDGCLLVPFEHAGWYTEALKQPNTVILPENLIPKLVKQFGDKIQSCSSNFNRKHKFMETDPENRQQFLLKECVNFFSEVGLKIKYPVVVANFEDKGVLGCAANDQIVLSTKVFDMGRKQIVITLMEEHMHLDSKCSDETREFQDYILNQLITMLENQHGMFL